MAFVKYDSRAKNPVAFKVMACRADIITEIDYCYGGKYTRIVRRWLDLLSDKQIAHYAEFSSLRDILNHALNVKIN